jgi:signal transduction histidine kinase/DNA-binding response OmpR family regulator
VTENHGVVSFLPDSIQHNPHVPPVVITDVKVFDKSVFAGENAPLKNSVSGTTDLELHFNQNFLSFEFAALNYIHPEKNQYKYKMEGLDQDWIEAGTRRYAGYPDLKPGEYTFRVIGSNNDNVWNMGGASLEITILPPWWFTIYAYFGYVFFVFILVMGFVRLRTWQIRRDRDRLEILVGERTEEIKEQKEKIESQKDLVAQQNERILELDRAKTRFFTNVSHEFRTPITLIQGPVEDLLEKARLNKKENSKLQMVSRNAQRLLTLVNQLLDIAKLESGTMRLKLREEDLLANLRTIASSFSSLAETKGIVYNRSIPRESFVTWFDPGILEKVLANLLSNAFKFTQEAGEVTFTARLILTESPEMSDQIECMVTDQGPGIPFEDQQKIFTRFYQVEGRKTTMGTGIGLSLVKDLVQLYHGHVSVESEEGKGSTFIVQLPLGKDHLKESEYDLVGETAKDIGAQSPSRAVDAGVAELSEKPVEEVKESGKPIVLIVEDNSDIRSHIREHLEGNYEVLEAVNGQAGQIKAFEIIPDLMITDLMMPLMDGEELCKEIKSDERTSHIPVIMLTAKATQEAKLEGLQIGADDYIAKPFDMQELKTRIANLIEQRRKLRERYSREITLEPKDITVTSVDEEFLERAIKTVEERMADEEFDMGQFQDAMNMSHSTLFRKLQALTDQSPTVFIRNIRLKRSAQLLREHYGNVASVSYEVGFSNPSYFSKCFKELYGVSPADYTREETPIH